jgi:heme o synthase
MGAVSQPLALPSGWVAATIRDYSDLVKLRVTSLIVMTAWCGYYFASRQSGFPVMGVGLVHALLGIGLVSSGTAALNEVIERDTDRLMTRTARRPMPAGRMTALHGAVVGVALAVVGSLYLAFFTNALTGLLTFLTSVVYLAVYTPLKRVSPWCTFVGAFPGAMPGVLGWTAASGKVGIGAAALFAILFLWQFPHFFSIAWLYREDYAQGGIRMLPVVEPSGRATAQRILAYSLILIPVSMVPTFMGMAGRVYLGGAVVLGVLLFCVGLRLALLKRPIASGISKMRARQLLQATIVYLPVLFVIMMMNSK